VEIEAEEQVLDLALVAIIGGIMPQVSTRELRQLISEHYDVPGHSFLIRRHQTEDFLIVFSFTDGMLRVFHDRPPPSPVLVFKR
jgi:uncharacterized protein YjeT (DUF2065 family)